MRPLARTALAFLLAAILNGPGMAGYQADCLSGTGDLVISGCTTAIESGKWSDSGLRWAYNTRGSAYYQKGEYERAAADFTEVIKLDPKDAFAHNFRGRSYVELGKYQLAIADFDDMAVVGELIE